jgi:hypothetical protein
MDKSLKKKTLREKNDLRSYAELSSTDSKDEAVQKMVQSSSKAMGKKKREKVTTREKSFVSISSYYFFFMQTQT